MDTISNLVGPRSQRSDARRNRERIITAAAEIFGEQGADAAMEAVAERAGVGVGSLYRAFGSKAELLHEIYVTRVNELLASTRQAAALEEPQRALEHYLTVTVAFFGKNRLVADLRSAVPLDPTWTNAVHHQRLELVKEIVQRAHQAELIHPSLTATDIEFLLRATCWISQDSEVVRSKLCSRILPIMLGSPTQWNGKKLAAPLTDAAYKDFTFAGLHQD